MWRSPDRHVQTGFPPGKLRRASGMNRVERDGQTLRLRPKSMDVLAFLAEHPGQVASRDEVLAAVWADSNVAEEGLTRCIAEIRQALDDDVHRPRTSRRFRNAATA